MFKYFVSDQKGRKLNCFWGKSIKGGRGDNCQSKNWVDIGVTDNLGGKISAERGRHQTERGGGGPPKKKGSVKSCQVNLKRGKGDL